jgi:hypothetical protein
MFIIRTAFWLSLIVLLLPTDTQQQKKLYTTASNAAHHAATFCDRNQGICAQGAQYWATFRTKLEFGARMTADLVAERMLGAKERPASAALPATTDGLTPADLAPQFRRPATVRTGA